MRFLRLLNNKLLSLLIIYSLLYAGCAVLFHQYNDVWWDSTSYIGLAKYIAFDGSQGIFEPMKPILLPLFLASFIKIGLDMIFFGKFLIFLVSLATLIFVYLISKEFFNEKIALWATAITAFNPLFFIFAFRLYTEMLTLAGLLGGIYFVLLFVRKEKAIFLFLAGLFCAFAFMSKYPNALLAVLIDFFLLFRAIKKKTLYELIVFNLSLLVFMLPFFLLGIKFGADYLYFFKVSQEYFKLNLGHLYSLGTFPGIPKLFFVNTPWLYFKSIIYLVNILLPFSLYGMYLSFRNENKLKILYFVMLPMIIFFCFFEIFYLKQERYIMIVFPLLSIFTAYGLSKIKNKLAWFLIAVYIISVLVWSSIFLYNSYAGELGYRDFFVNPPTKLNCSIVASSDPRSILKYDHVTFPYEVYDKTWKPDNIVNFKPDCIFYYSCFEKRNEQVLVLENLSYKLDYQRENGKCLYAIFYKPFNN